MLPTASRGEVLCVCVCLKKKIGRLLMLPTASRGEVLCVYECDTHTHTHTHTRDKQPPPVGRCYVTMYVCM